jgi:hypothetical protein
MDLGGILAFLRGFRANLLFKKKYPKGSETVFKDYLNRRIEFKQF